MLRRSWFLLVTLVFSVAFLVGCASEESTDAAEVQVQDDGSGQQRMDLVNQMNQMAAQRSQEQQQNQTR